MGGHLQGLLHQRVVRHEPLRQADAIGLISFEGKPMARRMACPLPTQRARRAEPPYAGKMPRATCGSRHSARSEATSRSQQKVMMHPMPTAWPLTAPTSGLAKFESISKGRFLRLGMLLMNSAVELSVCVWGFSRLAPAEKAPPGHRP